MRKGWEVKKLGEVYDVRDGTHDSPKYYESGFPLVTSKNLKDGKITLDDIRYISESDFININKRSKVDSGDVLFAMIGTIGNPVVVTEDSNFAIKNVALFKVRKGRNSWFLKYYLDSFEVIDRMNKEAKGTTQRFVGLGYLRDFDIPVPPLNEENRIVAILDEAFEAIDQAKANTEKNLQNAQELFQSELNSIFTNKGEGWVEKKLNQISENLDSKRIPITKNVRSSGEYPYYGASGIVDYVADYIFDDDLLLVSEDGANLLARTYPIAFPVSGKIWVNNHAHVLKFDDLTTQRFVEYYLNSIRLDPFVSGMAQPKLNQAMLNRIPIPVPPIKDQKQIVFRLDALSVETKQLEENYQKRLESLEELKKSILQKAFSGELTTVKEIAL
ncbi:MAG: restriction endonuclease subunit S [Prolixibacteraceae bacterium]|nr:restriction endonuclease subunit S [Prolixibacteraceae bacterium]